MRTGLGLSVVHGIATQSGGTLRISSAPNIGTTIELWLPQARTSSARAGCNEDLGTSPGLNAL
jgi:signal transduction histidine kinase